MTMIRKKIENFGLRLQAAWIALFYRDFTIFYTDKKGKKLKTISIFDYSRTKEGLEKFRKAFYDSVKRIIDMIMEHTEVVDD